MEQVSDHYLVGFDTDRIKEYIFATSDLKRVRGASALLERLNQEDTKQTILRVCNNAGIPLSPGNIVHGGGAALARLPSKELAQEVIAAIECLYRTETVNGTVSGAYVRAGDNDGSSVFGERIAELGIRLRQVKDSRGYEPTVPLTSYLRPCSACGRLPAATPDRYEAGQFVCRSCQIKQRQNEADKRVFWEEFQEAARRHQGSESPWPGLDEQREREKDLGTIGATSRPAGYLGFIYADGNLMGTLLRQMPSFEAYKIFATELDALVRRVTYRALLDVLKQPRHGIAPFEFLLLGGDDLMLVVASDVALDLAVRITQAFEEEALQLLQHPEVALDPQTPLSLSAGVVIAHDSFPLKAMHDLASDLLKRAKRASAEKGNVGTIDFMVVTEAATAGLEVVRDSILSSDSFEIPYRAEKKIILTERPYTASALSELLGIVRQLKSKGFSNRALQAMYEALFYSKMQAQLVTLTTLMRARGEPAAVLWDFLRTFNTTGGLQVDIPWRKQADDSYSTPLGDLVEIYPYVRRL